MIRISTRQLFAVILLIFVCCGLAACSPSSSNSDAEHSAEEMGNEMGEMEGMDHEDGEHAHDAKDRIANEAASIHILAPNDGAALAAGEELLVEVQVDQFALGEDGKHWHVYVDGASHGMVLGGRTVEALRGLETGKRVIEVYLAGGDHIELQEGDSIEVLIE